jgi:predicted AlkP superfamily phosphohydrolase/phosphomutase
VNESEKPDFEDFVTVKPELVLILTKDQMDLAMEHIGILKELVTKNLTVKEIHSLYWDSSKKEYSKTIKTIYRYMDSLEEVGLVKVAGHRKPTDSRMTEKLYCRTAMVFTQKEEDRGPRWYETKKGKTDLRETSKLILRFFENPEEKVKDLENLLIRYYSTRDKTVGELLQKLATDETLAEMMVKIGMDEFKSMASLLGMLGVLLDLPDFQNLVNDVLA